jgi:methyl-accepting chemotaxis protein
MKWFYDLSIRTKLVGSFVLVAIVAGCIGVVGIINIKKINRDDTILYANYTAPLTDLNEMTANYQRMRVGMRDMLLASTPSALDEKALQMNDYWRQMVEASKNYEASIQTPEMREQFAALEAAFRSYDPLRADIERLARSGDLEGAKTRMKGGIATAIEVNNILVKMAEMKAEGGKKISDANTKTANAAVYTMIAFLLFGVFTSIILGFVISSAIATPLGKGVTMMQELANGHLQNRLRMERKDEVGALARAMDGFAEDLQRHVIGSMQKIAAGDLAVNMTPKDNNDEIAPALNSTAKALRDLVTEASMLSKAAVEGRLETRGDATKFQGGYREIVAGVNGTLDAVIGPLNMAAGYVDRISKGDIPSKITDSYNGDFNTIKNNLNTCIDAVNAMINDASMLSRAAVEGRLATRADASKHQGDFRKIVQGVNETLDAVIGPLNVAAGYVDRISKGDIPNKITDNYSGDFNTIKTNLNTCIDAVNGMIADAKMLSQAAVEGKLATRADASKHQGDFRTIVQGVNETLDAVIGPITEAAQVLERVAERDLSARVQGNYRGDLGKIKESLNAAVSNLDTALAQVSVAVEQVASASSQIGQGSQALAQAASEQASSLEEVSSSLQEMASMTKQNAGHSKEARGLAESSRQGANKGLEAANRLSDAMDKIKTSSDATAKIVKTIDEIAFQTNLLALNAAVEAARAGDAGKGFAVVAEEVRNLAMRSAEAAKNTANLIEESVQNAESGVELNQAVYAQLQDITSQTNKVGEVMAEIALGSEQQTGGITQITTAVEQMNQLTQQNAASSEESASAAEELSAQSAELRQMVSAFHLSGEGATSTTSRPKLQLVSGHGKGTPAAARPGPTNAGSGRKSGGGTTNPSRAVKVAGAGRMDPEQFIPFHDDNDTDTMKEF